MKIRIAAAVTAIALLLAACGTGQDPVEQAAKVRQDILNLHNVDSFQQALTSDPSNWAGYIAQVRIDKYNLYIQIQTTDQYLAESAAQALATYFKLEDTNAEGLDWVIIEDPSGTVMTQQKIDK